MISQEKVKCWILHTFKKTLDENKLSPVKEKTESDKKEDEESDDDEEEGLVYHFHSFQRFTLNMYFNPI